MFITELRCLVSGLAVWVLKVIFKPVPKEIFGIFPGNGTVNAAPRQKNPDCSSGTRLVAFSWAGLGVRLAFGECQNGEKGVILGCGPSRAAPWQDRS